MTIDAKALHRNVTCRIFGHDWQPEDDLLACTRCGIDNAPEPQSPRPGYPDTVAPAKIRCTFFWRRYIYGGNGPWTFCVHAQGHGNRHEDGNGSWVAVGYESVNPDFVFKETYE